MLTEAAATLVAIFAILIGVRLIYRPLRRFSRALERFGL